MEGGRGYVNWAGLPPELTSLILVRLGAVEILENAQNVCTAWYRACKDPSMWQKIVMHDERMDFDDYDSILRHRAMCRNAVDRSQGGLVEIDIRLFCTDSLLNQIADSSSRLKILRLPTCHLISPDTLVQAAAKLALLEELDISHGGFDEEFLKVLGKSLPNLKTFKLNSPIITYDDDKFAIAIAESMPGLRHLELYGNYSMTNTSLEAILDACPHLEHLDLRECDYIDLVGDLEKRCSERIRVFKPPDAE